MSLIPLHFSLSFYNKTVQVGIHCFRICWPLRQSQTFSFFCVLESELVFVLPLITSCMLLNISKLAQQATFIPLIQKRNLKAKD